MKFYQIEELFQMDINGYFWQLHLPGFEAVCPCLVCGSLVVMRKVYDHQAFHNELK